MLDQQNFSKKLIKWFQAERAHLPVPGRGVSNPYAIWVAEVMLQQTQVTTVWPYYNNWMRDYPTISHLAAAEQDQVLKSWEGLGYYSRARNLHRGAKFVMDEFGGALPVTVTELLEVPGIGPYTSAAIASLAFGETIPLIDGNVLRVFARLTRLKTNITLTKTRSDISLELAKLIPLKYPAAFNQGLMDLGRAVCTPRNPDCANCPINQTCEANQAGDMEDYPVKPQRKSIPHYHIVVGLIRRDQKLLIQRRPENGLLGGLWEFPGGKIEKGELGEAALLREIKEETGLDIDLGWEIGTINHAYTHFKITLTAWFCDWISGEAQRFAATENRWVYMDELKDYALPKANNKILDILAK
ncbi:MAG: A/G-specific adenine glycosylase [Candidatus Marinimicrobia bacterium]|nr:A/G-specific adenine glycosylase [Candidatus Neomarinimicrobiota bacterium]MBT4360773.1 A/G-specific adenine glycosylase [Candidatus Neomarinimicrobiota bacterium]MBT4944677.1 A/G-specific adenine glycosylase [Candidatus Neomarinimicrobiota bacterium]MBT5268176.1 A/G-specific adenine glycosylase [Candidatus Neomarinimicrobiota bacterium]MBT6012186.1 A/G-specific adenine glycosylase [Candidatus Neomarinimicrobiota bacterium]